MTGVAGCGGGDGDPPRNDGGPPPPTPATVQNIAAYEGQQSFVTVLASGGDDWTDATVSASSEGLVIRAQRCNASLCAIVAEVPDTVRNTGQTIPAPIDAMRHFLVVTTSRGRSQGLVQVFPTDALTIPEDGVANVSGVYFAASLHGAMRSTARAAGSEPVRWVVFGDATLDHFDASALLDVNGAGAWAGGAAGEDGEGPSGGAAAAGTVGAGGGGSFEPGAPGATASTGAPASNTDCASDFFAPACGGSGGGGASGAGGGGGGSVSIIVLGTGCVARFSARGGDAAAGSGGGGGGGGLAVLAASRAGCESDIDVTGGAADGEGGAGGAGAAWLSGRDFPRVELDPAMLLVSDAMYQVSGMGTPGRTLRVERVSDGGAESVGSGEIAASGAFAVDVRLVPGLNRLRITQTLASGAEPQRGWSGNHIELERRDGAVRQLPVGGLLDVAYIP